MNKIVHHLIIYLVVSLLGFIAGQFPGWIQIHSSGDASYISGTKCVINATSDIGVEKFELLEKWCLDKYKSENSSKIR